MPKDSQMDEDHIDIGCPECNVCGHRYHDMNEGERIDSYFYCNNSDCTTSSYVVNYYPEHKEVSTVIEEDLDA